MPRFTHPHHICIVVDDLPRALALYESVGIGPWTRLGRSADLAELEGAPAEAFGALTFMCADVGGFQLQLVEPKAGDTPHWRFLQERGPGVFSLSFSADSVDQAEDEARTAGLDVLMRGRRADRSGFAYFDTRAEAGVNLQVRQAPNTAPADA